MRGLGSLLLVGAIGAIGGTGVVGVVVSGGCEREVQRESHRESHRESGTAPAAGGASAPTAAADQGSESPSSSTAPPSMEASAESPGTSSPLSDRPEAFAATPRPPAPEAGFKPADPRIDMARRMIQTQEFSVAEVALNTVLREKPGTAQAEFLLGVAIQKQKRYGEARSHFERAITLKQSYPEVDHAFHFLGWACYYLGEMTPSRQAFEEHLRRVPDEADSVFGLGLVAIEEDRIEDAEALFVRTLEMHQARGVVPRADVAKARARLGDVYLRLDRQEDAERELATAVRIYPDAYEAWAKLARIYDRLGRSEDAERARASERSALERLGRISPGAPPQADTTTAPPSQP